MKVKTSTPISIRIGEKRNVLLPHQRLDLPDALEKKLLKLHSDVLRRVR